jgi:sensor c-di-GMP phosphodiesterase-like protein
MIRVEDIEEGFNRNEFFLEYQPIVSLKNSRCIGAEALIRWRRNGKVIMPCEFIPLSENTPVSGVITYWVVETAGSEMGDWLRRHPDSHLSFNLPPEIAGRGGVYYAGVKSGLQDVASQLIVEIHERGLPDALALEGFRRARNLGVKIALDDVTQVGGANLAILSRCPIDMVKLDRSLIAQITANGPRPEWLDGIAALIWSSGMTVFAEGVETEHQLQVLFDAGIQAAQGFLFARPLLSHDLIAFHQQANGQNGPQERPATE